MRTANVFLIGLVLSLSCWNVRAEVLTNPASLKKDSAIHQYLFGKAAGERMRQSAHRIDKYVGVECGSGYRIGRIKLIIVAPIDLPTGATHPVSGEWIYRYETERCGDTKTYNLKMKAAPSSAPQPSALPLGDFLASPRLMGDAWMSALVVAARDAIDPACKTATIHEAHVSKMPHRDAEGIKGVWHEVWTIRGCGASAKVPIEFIPDGKGGTTFAIRH